MLEILSNICDYVGLIDLGICLQRINRGRFIDWQWSNLSHFACYKSYLLFRSDGFSLSSTQTHLYDTRMGNSGELLVYCGDRNTPNHKDTPVRLKFLAPDINLDGIFPY